MQGDPRNVFSQPYTMSFNKPKENLASGASRKHTVPGGNAFVINNNGRNSQSRPLQSRNIQYQKSRVSHHSDESYNLGLMLNQAEMVPQDLLFLLSDEDKNISSFKQKIEKEKIKLENDFSNFKRQIEHIVQDLKISLQAELDLIYKCFIEKYANLKSQVQQIRRVRKQIEAHNYSHDILTNAHSNKELVKELERDAENYKRYRVQNYIAELQKKKLNPILDISKEIILMGTTSTPYYNADSTLKQLNQLKANFGHFTKHMFASLNEYVRAPQNLEENYLDDLQSDGQKSEYNREQFQIPVRNKTRQNLQTPKYNNLNTFDPRTDFQQGQNFSLRPQKKYAISQSQQIISGSWIEDINMKPLYTLKPDHTDIILCAIVIDNKYVATGGKDKVINVHTLDGTKVATLRAHQASICTLAILEDNGRKYLMSGSDHGCSSVILWNVDNWSVKVRLQSHSAAVTAIVDLGDSQTMVSGSYDKKINVYNHRKGTLLYNLPNNKSSVTSIITNSTKTKLISCGLDSTAYIWSVIRRKDNAVVESIALENVIQNNCMISSLNSSLLRSEIIVAGTKDGKIKFWNINTGELEKTLTANNNAIIELVVIERESKPNFPIILSCSSKDKALVMTRTDTGINSYYEVGDKLNIEFGCGIGPKIIFDRYRQTPIIGLASQVATRKQFNLFELELF